MLTPAILVLVPAIVAAAYVIFGIIGFGSTLIAVPLLAHLLPLKFVIPMIVLLDFAAALRIGTQFRADINKREIAYLLPFMLLGMVSGVLLLIKLPANILLLSLGLFVCGYGFYTVRGKEATLTLSRAWSLPTGLIGGTFSALFSSGGPLYVMYLVARGLDKTQLRSTMSAIFIVTTATRIVLFALSGLYAQDGILLTAALLFPLMLVGLYFGNRLHLNLPHARVLQFVGGWLVISGASLIVRALA
ncbi:MAG: sulfite exporter TauE/SafE family protein [Betaproteobacteria bacterium]|nr:MAG: sulfite exporter TauE/SafE family protein [Betaproteobacteria bacterium]